MESLATEFGPYYCDQNIELGVFKMMLYLGTLCGYPIFLSITDNYGRKKAIVMAWATTTIGLALLCAAFNIIMATIGLFFAGMGCESCIRISMSIFS